MMDLSSVNYDQIFKRYDILVEAKEKPEDIAAKILPKDALLKKVAEDVVFMKYKDVELLAANREISEADKDLLRYKNAERLLGTVPGPAATA